MNKGADLNAFSDIEETDSFGPVNLVPAGGEHINMILIHIDRHMTVGLNRIRMEKDTVLLGNLANFLYGLNGTDLIVGKHNGNQNRVRTNRLL